MRIALLAVALVAACGPGRTTFARYPGAKTTFDRAAQDPEALAIADRVIAAAGGAQTWNGAKQLRWSQAVTQDGKPVISGEQAWDRWNGRHHGRAKREGGDLVIMRHVYEDGGHAFVDASEGERIRLKRIEGGAAQALAAGKERWEFDTAILFMPFLLEEPGTKLEYGGETLGDDEKIHDILKVSFDPADRTRTATYQVMVSRETNLIDRIEIQKAGKSENERLGYAITKQLEAAGLKLPGTLENLGLKGEVVTFTGLTIAEPDENLYVPPL